MDKQEVETKLQEAFDNGFVPKEIREYMTINGHEGQVWVVPQDDITRPEKHGKKTVEVPVYRIGIGYKLLDTGTDEEGNEFEREASHVLVYDQDEIQEILKEIK